MYVPFHFMQHTPQLLSLSLSPLCGCDPHSHSPSSISTAFPPSHPLNPSTHPQTAPNPSSSHEHDLLASVGIIALDDIDALQAGLARRLVPQHLADAASQELRGGGGIGIGILVANGRRRWRRGVLRFSRVLRDRFIVASFNFSFNFTRSLVRTGGA